MRTVAGLKAGGSVDEAQRHLAKSFALAGIESGLTDARALIGAALRLSRAQLLAQSDRLLEPREIAAIDALAARRMKREPVSRILGRKEFWSLMLDVTPDVLVPRPDTEASGRIHTSAATVAVLPEVEDVDIDIKDADLKIDTMRAQGAGGQHVNKTESAIRITHMPSGIVVYVQEERSQHKNRAKAMAMLRARLYDQQRTKLDAERAAERRGQIGTGDRSERIRTYNFPQGRVTDHRINLTLYKLPQVIEGEALGELIDALVTQHQADLLAAEGM